MWETEISQYILTQAAIGAANGNHQSKDYARAIPYYELSVEGVRKYYHPYCGYLGSTLEKYAECLFNSGKTDKVVIEKYFLKDFILKHNVLNEIAYFHRKIYLLKEILTFH